VWQEYLGLSPGELVKTPDHISDEEAAAALSDFSPPRLV